jgi:hypothetical protein
MMVNYVYRLGEVERNHEAYARDRAIVASRGLQLLARQSPMARPSGTFPVRQDRPEQAATGPEPST